MKTPLSTILRGLMLVVATLAPLVLAAVGADRPPKSATTAIHSIGTYNFADSGVTITLTEPEAGALGVNFRHNHPTGYSATGTSKDSPISVAPKNWLVVFVAPNELWIFDGMDSVKLYERTIEPRGFKATDSRVKASLLKRAPGLITDALAKSRAN